MGLRDFSTAIDRSTPETTRSETCAPVGKPPFGLRSEAGMDYTVADWCVDRAHGTRFPEEPAIACPFRLFRLLGCRESPVLGLRPATRHSRVSRFVTEVVVTHGSQFVRGEFEL